MDAAEVADAFGVMAVLAIVGVLGAGVVAGVHPPTRARLRALIDEHGRVSVWLVALVATGGSLWFSESAGFTPCELCWHQRIAMYPLVVVLGLRALRAGGSRDLRLAGLILVAAGLVVNLWHVAIETRPSLESGACDPLVPCSLRWVEGLGFFTIPRLATVAFVLIGLGLVTDRTDRRVGTGEEDPYAARDDITLEEDRA